jgi:hypothetical protein
MVFAKQLPATVNEYSDDHLLAAFERLSSLDGEEIRRRLVDRWGTPSDRRRTWRRALGPVKSVAVGVRGLRDVAASKVKAVFGRAQQAVEIGTRA